MTENNWLIHEDILDWEKLNHNETIFTTGNGYLGTRGTFEERYPGENRATFVHGIFDDVPIFFTELVNFPDWLELEVLLDGERFSLDQGEILAYRRTLDLKTALLSREVTWRSPTGKVTRLLFERFPSLAAPNILLMKLTLTPQNYDGQVEIRSGLDGRVDNLGFTHWQPLGQGVNGNTAWLELQTRASRMKAAAAMRLHLHGEIHPCDVRAYPSLHGLLRAEAGKNLVVEKTVVISTSREQPEPCTWARAQLENLALPAWEHTWADHVSAWQSEWEQCDVLIEGDDQAQLAVRFNLFQLLIAAPRKDERVSIGAKTLSGYGYRGHTFWDTEIFMLPFFIYTRPEIARNLLLYRYHTLDGARRKASANGYRGAQYPWESATTGDEVTPTWVPHPSDPKKLVRIWTGDIQIHISADISLAIWNYWQASGDVRFLLDCGAEIILETTRFWCSRAEWNASQNRYEFTGVIGPDEYHDHVDNNAYTNYLARWNIQKGIELFEWLNVHHPAAAQELFDRLGVTADEIAGWRNVETLIYCPYDPATGWIAQFDEFEQRDRIDLADLEPRSESVQSLFGIERTNELQVLKQPDVLMLLYLLPDLFGEKVFKTNYDYYTPRTDHTYGSSLGPAVQSILACRINQPEEAYQHFMHAVGVDLYDVRGNADDGIHAASTGGVWQALVFGFAGLNLDGPQPRVEPRLPAHWRRLAFSICWQGQRYRFDIRSENRN